jgi:hypothetical protein
MQRRLCIVLQVLHATTKEKHFTRSTFYHFLLWYSLPFTNPKNKKKKKINFYEDSYLLHLLYTMTAVKDMSNVHCPAFEVGVLTLKRFHLAFSRIRNLIHRSKPNAHPGGPPPNLQNYIFKTKGYF